MGQTTMTAGATALAVNPYEDDMVHEGPVRMRSGQIEHNETFETPEFLGAGAKPVEPQQAIDLIRRLQSEYATARDEAQRLQQKEGEEKKFGAYLGVLLLLVIAGAAAVWEANKRFAPMLYDERTLEKVADAHARGLNFGVFDLNINIRDLRNAAIARMERAPELVVLGASHWQEAHTSLLPFKDFYNSHVHRDYYEDMLAMTEMYVRHNKLPKEMIITIRDNLFTPVNERTDFLWLPGIKYYREMANRLGIAAHSHWDTMPVQTWRELISLPFLRIAAERQFNAPKQPLDSRQRQFKTLDTLLPGGSILWSTDHRAFFTHERARHEALTFAASKRNSPPRIDPKGVEAIDTLLGYLAKQGVRVTLAHPPFNPVYWDAVQGSEYMTGLEQVKELTRSFARKHDLAIIGSFNPGDIGCKSYMYIDAEHSSPNCLSKVLNQYAALEGQALRPSLHVKGQ